MSYSHLYYNSLSRFFCVLYLVLHVEFLFSQIRMKRNSQNVSLSMNNFEKIPFSFVDFLNEFNLYYFVIIMYSKTLTTIKNKNFCIKIIKLQSLMFSRMRLRQKWLYLKAFYGWQCQQISNTTTRTANHYDSYHLCSWQLKLC